MAAWQDESSGNTGRDDYQDDLLTPELRGWLAEDQITQVGEYLYPFVHRATLRYRMHRHLYGNSAEDLLEEAFLHVLTQVRQRFAAGTLKRFSTELLFMMIGDCYAKRCRDANRDALLCDNREVDADGNLLIEGVSDPSQQFLLQKLENNGVLSAALERLEKPDRETLRLFSGHYRLCEEALSPDCDTSDHSTIKEARSSAMKHLVVSLAVNLSTVYRRVNRSAERLRELMDT